MIKKITGPMQLDPDDLSGDFAHRLYSARRTLGWSQSELARRVWGTMTDARGYEVAKNRDRISAYEAGRAKPERDNLDAVAEALGLTAGQLAPDVLALRAESAAAPAIRMTMLENEPNNVRLSVDVVTSLSLASKIIAMLSDDPNTNGTN